jgi:hypothetical protein
MFQLHLLCLLFKTMHDSKRCSCSKVLTRILLLLSFRIPRRTATRSRKLSKALLNLVYIAPYGSSLAMAVCDRKGNEFLPTSPLPLGLILKICNFGFGANVAGRPSVLARLVWKLLARLICSEPLREIIPSANSIYEYILCGGQVICLN